MVYIDRRLTYIDAQGVAQGVSEADLATWKAPVVILGEPGMGKTELLMKLPERHARFEYVTAKALMRRNIGVEVGRVLVIDGLDELPARQEHDPVQDVLGWLSRFGWPDFFLSCRAADWRTVAKQEIDDDYGVEPIELKLSPLSSDEATEFLSHTHGLDRAEPLIAQLKARGLEEFFGNPLTLQLLDRLASQPEGLPDNRAELFLRASSELRKEQNPKRPRSRLSTISASDALDAAGAACAALILTGAEAIHVGAQGSSLEGDLDLADLAALPRAEAIDTIISSMLFQRRELGDRLAPFHRALAEFLGARWLAAEVKGRSSQRLLALMSYHGGVPASLRGLHAWLAYFSEELAPEVIAADPYGVLRYGDAAALTPTAARALLRALERLAKADPYFRSEDWTHHSAPGLTQRAMTDELRRVLFTPDSSFHLKSLILAALPKSEAAQTLEPELEAMMMAAARLGSVNGPTNDRVTFHERRAAFDILAAQRQPETWTTPIETLLRGTSDDDRRLAVEAIYNVGAEHFAAGQIARAALSYLGLLPGLGTAKDKVDTSGPLYLLGRGLSAGKAGAILDAIAVISPATKLLEWSCQYAYSALLDRLIATALDEVIDNPVRLLTWLRLSDQRHGHGAGDTEARGELHTFLQANMQMRRAIQRHVIFQEAAQRSIDDAIWHLQSVHYGLNLDEGDLVDILSLRVFEKPQGDMRAIWRRLVSQGRNNRGLLPTIRTVAERSAVSDAELQAFLVDLDQKRIPDWEREEKIRKRRTATLRRRRFERARIAFKARLAEVVDGDWNALSGAGQAYLNHFHELSHNKSPRERVAEWLGDENLGHTLVGFEALLRGNKLPCTPLQIAESYGQSRFWYCIYPLLAAACERVAQGGEFEDLPSDLVVSIALGALHNHLREETGGEKLEAVLQAWFARRPGEHERFWRLAIESQLGAGRQHVAGLYSFMRDSTATPLATRLAIEWLTTCPAMTPETEAELLDHLSRHGEWDDLRRLISKREALGWRDNDQRLLWLAIAFFAEFSGHEADLSSAAAEHPELFWMIRNRGWPSLDTSRVRAVGVDQLAWIVRTFRGPFPATSHPVGSTSGDTNPWDASEFIDAIIRRLAADTSDSALSALAALRDTFDDGYLPVLQNATAQQLKARREAGFTPASLSQVQAVLEDGRPTSPADLQALVLDALAKVQQRMGRDDVDQIELFYDGDRPKNEERCRNALVILVRDAIGHGVDTTPERLMPGARRADIEFALGDFRLPVEAKGQWHRDLWKSASEQLDELYTIEWRAQGRGIYVVFWFGTGVGDQHGLRSPGRGRPKPGSPEELRTALVERLPEHRRGQIAVVVLDVAR